ncbi:MAG TPA: zf-HC2 domain-containing protein [Pyrinomonadaceae bacterium]|nr:zf-HC2 domain-containing protein [Pyrinomonadaceae bacterium]
MDCAKSLELLSDFHDGVLDTTAQSEVKTHLETCRPCAGVFRDLDTIVMAAAVLRAEPGIAFPDDTLVWQRLSISKGPIH